MKPEKGNEFEVEGVLNPAVARGPDGELYLFPRLVAEGNYSRIGIVRVIFDGAGEPKDVERLGIVLEPHEDYEKHPGGGGCEDARITYLECVGHYIMTYTAFGPEGPRIAMARSKDLFSWERMGLVQFESHDDGDIEFNTTSNKDACFFPVSFPSPYNTQSIAMIHRPLYPETIPEETIKKGENRKINEYRESIWISYFHLINGKETSLENAEFTSHFCLAHPVYPWENLKIGGGAPPIMTKHGWLMVYHGVQKQDDIKGQGDKYIYSAGAMVLSKDDPEKILYRSHDPILIPELTDEVVGTVGNVVFPTGIDKRDDIGQPNRIDVYYGMADRRIGVAKMQIPNAIPITK